MTRRILVFGLFLLMFTGVAAAADLVMLEPLGSERAIRGPVASELDDLDDLFFIQRFTSSAEYYLGSGDQFDTMAVVFQPLAPCSIYFAQLQWYTGGNFQTFIWEYGDGAAEMYPDGRAPNRGTSPVSPLGDVLFGPYQNSSTGSQSFENLFSEGDLPGGGVWIEDGRKFVVGFVKTGEGGDPFPLADDVSGRRFTYTWFGGPWTEAMEHIWGAYSGNIQTDTVVDLMLRVAVSYPLGAPPLIGSMNQLPNTVNGSKECTVVCEIIDDNGWDEDDSAVLLVSVNDGNPTEYTMSQIQGTNDFSATFTIDAEVGDEIAYWIEAVDDEDGFNSNIDEQLWFNVVEFAHPGADILMVDHGSAAWQGANYYFWENDYYFEFWDADDNKGIDEFTVDNDWGAVFIFGWGASTVPTRSLDNAYMAYAEAGGNIFFSDMDYFYTNGEADEPTFSAGDFVYDVFGVAGGINDPVPTDSVYYGVAGNDLTNDFENDPFVIYPNVYSGDWADGVTGRAGATDLFTGEDQSINGGISYVNSFGGKTVYISFDVMAAMEDVPGVGIGATAQFGQLMGNVLTWFGATSAPESDVVTPLVYDLSQNYPNPFNPTTQITFTVPKAGNVAVKVFNLNGQEVATLFHGQAAPGNKSVTFDASNLSSGVYFYRMEADGFSTTRKMMLLK